MCVPFLLCCIWTVSELYHSCICSKDWLLAIVAIVVFIYYTDIFYIFAFRLVWLSSSAASYLEMLLAIWQCSQLYGSADGYVTVLSALMVI